MATEKISGSLSFNLGQVLSKGQGKIWDGDDTDGFDERDPRYGILYRNYHLLLTSDWYVLLNNSRYLVCNKLSMYVP